MSSSMFNPESGCTYMRAVLRFGTVFGILCAVTCIMPAGHRKMTRVKHKIERRCNLKLACSKRCSMAYESCNILQKKSPYFPNRTTMFSAVQAAGDIGSFRSWSPKIVVTAFCLRWYRDHCHTCSVFFSFLSVTAQVSVLLCPLLWFCNYIYFT